jgi:hypothetical protein
MRTIKARSEQNLPETDTIIRSVDDDIEKVESLIILQRKTLLKNSKDVYKPYRLFTELTPQHHCLTEIELSNLFALERKNSYLEYVSVAAKCVCVGQ